MLYLHTLDRSTTCLYKTLSDTDELAIILDQTPSKAVLNPCKSVGFYAAWPAQEFRKGMARFAAVASFIGKYRMADSRSR